MEERLDQSDEPSDDVDEDNNYLGKILDEKLYKENET